MVSLGVPHPVRRVQGLLHPEASHDSGRRPYFEGWYVKSVSRDTRHRFALIPGIFRGDDPTFGDGSGPDAAGDGAFVQVLDGATGASWFVPYPADQYSCPPDRFDVRVGPNRFGPGGYEVDIDHADLRLRGVVEFTTPLDPWPVSVRSPGAMGWYAYVPMMECYHGVTSFGHGLSGRVEVNGSTVVLDGGRGYVEQDWGKGFPVGYVWMHSNTFGTPGTSLMASLAVIPWLRGEFPGLLVGLRTSGGLHRFATYNGSDVADLRVDDQHVELVVGDRSGRTLSLRAVRGRGALLHAPIRTHMHRRVEETLDATIDVTLCDASGDVILSDTGRCGGLEVHGQIDRLLK